MLWAAKFSECFSKEVGTKFNIDDGVSPIIFTKSDDGKLVTKLLYYTVGLLWL